MARTVGALATLPKGGSHKGEALLIGFYGCTNRLVTVGYRGPGNRRPVALEVTCPACGNEHRVSKLMWRSVEVEQYERVVEIEVRNE